MNGIAVTYDRDRTFPEKQPVRDLVRIIHFYFFQDKTVVQVPDILAGRQGDMLFLKQKFIFSDHPIKSFALFSATSTLYSPIVECKAII
jgi:hypothetical protein